MIVTCKCLATLYVLITWPIATPIGSAPASRPARTRTMIGASSFSVAASRASWVRARSAASTGVAAGDQPLAGVVRLGDLGQVLPVEQAYLQRPAAGGQPLDRRTPSAVTRAAADDRQPAGRDPAGAGMALAAGRPWNSSPMMTAVRWLPLPPRRSTARRSQSLRCRSRSSISDRSLSTVSSQNGESGSAMLAAGTSIRPQPSRRPGLSCARPGRTGSHSGHQQGRRPRGHRHRG